MVRILANGEIVRDDDPRVRAGSRARGDSSRQVRRRRGHRAVPVQPRVSEAGRALNRQLGNVGFPLWDVGNRVAEPVMSILLLFLLLMLGVRGLLLVGLAYVVSRLSRR
uniref:DUF4605 domain-containing protein n=1 Tax=Ornithorhynchus anatinus TaxID=9258 RepID=F7CF71_ORNAN